MQCMTSLASRKPEYSSSTSVSVHTSRINSFSLVFTPNTDCDKHWSLSRSFRWVAASEMHHSAPHHNGEDHVYPRNSISLPEPEETSLSELCAWLHERVSSFLESQVPSDLLRNVQRQTATSLGVLKEALDQYSIDELALSYNGGKDCLVLLVLWLVTLHRHFGRSQSASSTLSPVANSTRFQEDFPTTIQTVYIRPSYPFQEVEDFVHYSSQHYHLTLTTLTKSMKAAFTEYLERNPQVKAIFVGTRRTDPHGAELGHFNRTDGGWPDFMRCHPVIDWHYQEIWAVSSLIWLSMQGLVVTLVFRNAYYHLTPQFIRYLNIPYCTLYDYGYTSLGGTDDTHPNPRLRTPSEDGDNSKFVYKPAYELLEDEEERLGRPGGT